MVAIRAILWRKSRSAFWFESRREIYSLGRIKTYQRNKSNYKRIEDERWNCRQSSQAFYGFETDRFIDGRFLSRWRMEFVLDSKRRRTTNRCTYGRYICGISRSFTNRGGI